MYYDEERFTQQLQSEFVGELQKNVVVIGAMISGMRTGRARADYEMERMRRDITNLGLLSRAAETPILEVALKRFSDYVAGLDRPTPAQLNDLDSFLDVLGGFAAGELEYDTDEAEFVRSLPVRRPADLDDLEQLSVEILLVDTNRTGARFVERELLSCGYRVTIVQRPIEGLELAIRIRPDLVIASTNMGDISGIEFAAMLGIPAATKKCPVALLTSHDLNHESLRARPDDLVVLRRDSFADDFAHSLDALELA